MRFQRTSLGIAFVLSVGSYAQAQEAKPYPPCEQQAIDPDTSGARAAFQAGNVSFNEADYPRAILYWEDAFRRDCSANSMLLNLARAYELNGQKRQAVAALETFLQREPNSKEKGPITRRIEVLKAAIQREEAEPAPSPAEPSPAPATAPTISEGQGPGEPLPPPARAKSRPVLPLVVAGVGGAVFIVGGLAWLGATGEVNQLSKQCENPEEFDNCPDDVAAKGNDALDRQRAAGAITLIGLPIMVGGLIWYFATPPKSDTATLVTPAVGRNFMGVSIDGRF